MSAAAQSAIVKPWYRQFYARRGDAEWASDRVSDRGYESGLEAIGGFIYVGTTTYGSPTEVVLRLHPSDPGVPYTADRHADTLVGGAGELALLNWSDDVPVARFALPAGDVRLRASWYGTAEAQAHPDCEVGGDDPSPERIVLDLWTAP